MAENLNKISEAVKEIRRIQGLIGQGLAKPLEKTEAFNIAKEAAGFFTDDIFQRKAEKLSKTTIWTNKTKDGFVSGEEAVQLNDWISLLEQYIFSINSNSKSEPTLSIEKTIQQIKEQIKNNEGIASNIGMQWSVQDVLFTPLKSKGLDENSIRSAYRFLLDDGKYLANGSSVGYVTLTTSGWQWIFGKINMEDNDIENYNKNKEDKFDSQNGIDGNKNRLSKILSALSPYEQKIIEMRSGLLDGVAHSVEEVGLEFEKRRDQIEKIEKEISDKVKSSFSGIDWELFQNSINKSIELYNNRIPDSQMVEFLFEPNKDVNKKLDKDEQNKEGDDAKNYGGREISENGDIKRAGKNAKPTIGSIELSREILDTLYGMRGFDGSMFGVFGKWGRGKTFLINEIKKRIEKSNRKDSFVVVDFNAWKYQDTPASWAYLYGELLEKYLGPRYYSEKNKTGNKKCNIIIDFLLTPIIRIKRFFRNFWLNILRFGIINLLLTIIISIAIISVTTIYSGYIHNFVSNIVGNNKIFIFIISSLPVIISLIPLLESFSFKETFSEIMKNLTKKPGFFDVLGLQHEIQKELEILLRAWFFCNSKKSLLLIVDDIDRCQEDRIIQIMDSLKVMLDNINIQKKIVVIAAVDERILMEVVKNKYNKIFKNEEDVEKLAREYLDKLFLCGLKLGDLTPDEKSTILNNVCKMDSEQQADSNDLNETDTPGNHGLVGNNVNDYDNFDDKKKLLDRDKMTLSEKESIKASITSLDYTPRQIDILVFRYLMARNLLKVFKSPKYDFDDLGMWIVDYADNKKLPSKGDIFDKIIEMVVPY